MLCRFEERSLNVLRLLRYVKNVMVKLKSVLSFFCTSQRGFRGGFLCELRIKSNLIKRN